MEIAEYEKMYKFEEKYWWWVGKREIVKGILDRLNLNSTNILDIGCGTGFNMNYLKDYGKIVGLDFSKEALNFCKMRGNKNLVQANAEKVPFKGDMFDLIITLDLLEHLDDNKILKEFYRALKPTGYLIVTVPAFEFLWSEHDEALHHKRRYNKSQLREILTSNGFITENISYWNFFLFLPIVAMRLIKRRMKSEEIETDVKELPNIVNMFLASVLSIEGRIISHGVNLPFGVSIVCVCKKSEGNEVK
jgi:SAM-dependent methyltransferase